MPPILRQPPRHRHPHCRRRRTRSRRHRLAPQRHQFRQPQSHALQNIGHRPRLGPPRLRFVIERQFGDPFTAIRAAALAIADLDQFVVIILPCTQGAYADTLNATETARLKACVNKGGALLSTNAQAPRPSPTTAASPVVLSTTKPPISKPSSPAAKPPTPSRASSASPKQTPDTRSPPASRPLSTRSCKGPR